VSGYYALVEGIETPQKFNIWRMKNGTKTREVMQMFPSKKYKLEDDELFKESLKGLRIRLAYSKALEDKLNTLGIPFKPVRCQTCGGKTTKLEYCPVEVVE